MCRRGCKPRRGTREGRTASRGGEKAWCVRGRREGRSVSLFSASEMDCAEMGLRTHGRGDIWALTGFADNLRMMPYFIFLNSQLLNTKRFAPGGEKNECLCIVVRLLVCSSVCLPCSNRGRNQTSASISNVFCLGLAPYLPDFDRERRFLDSNNRSVGQSEYCS